MSFHIRILFLIRKMSSHRLTLFRIVALRLGICSLLKIRNLFDRIGHLESDGLPCSLLEPVDKDRFLFIRKLLIRRFFCIQRLLPVSLPGFDLSKERPLIYRLRRKTCTKQFELFASRQFSKTGVHS